MTAKGDWLSTFYSWVRKVEMTTTVEETNTNLSDTARPNGITITSVRLYDYPAPSSTSLPTVTTTCLTTTSSTVATTVVSSTTPTTNSSAPLVVVLPSLRLTTTSPVIETSTTTSVLETISSLTTSEPKTPEQT